MAGRFVYCGVLVDSAVELVAGVVSGAGIGVTVAGGKGLAVGFGRGM